MRLRQEYSVMASDASRDIDRRTFIKGVSAGAVAASAGVWPGASGGETSSAMRYRRLGRTNLMVSEIGLGCSPSGQRHRRADYMKEMPKVILRALELGVNVIDSAPSYRSEAMVGEVLKSWPRDQVILCTKSEQTRKDRIVKELERSLKKLNTDYVDLLHEHAHYRRVEGAYERLEYVEAAEKLRKDGKLRFFGASGHNPTVLAEYIRTGKFDTVMAPYNYLTRRPEAELFPLATDLDVGVFAIKPLTGRYRIWDQQFGSNRRLDALAQQYSTKVYAEAAIMFVLSNEMLSCMLCGMERIQDVEANVACSGRRLRSTHVGALRTYERTVGDLYCRMCETCIPCPNGIAIPDIQRFHMYSANYGHPDYARELYHALPEQARATHCVGCGECEKRCPSGLPIREKLRDAHEVLA